jgi:hypothetical protein
MGAGSIIGAVRHVADINPIVPVMLAPVVGGVSAYAVARSVEPTDLGRALMAHPIPTIMVPMLTWGIGLSFVASHRAPVRAFAVDGAEQIARTSRPLDGATMPTLINATGGAAIGLGLGTETRVTRDWQAAHGGEQ